MAADNLTVKFELNVREFELIISLMSRLLESDDGWTPERQHVFDKLRDMADKCIRPVAQR